MMNIQELETKYAEIERLKQQPEGVWKPLAGKQFWTTDSDGYSFVRPGFFRLETRHHNFYKTEALANKASVLQRRSNLVIQACLNFDPDFVTDWSDSFQYKYGFGYNYAEGRWYKTPHTSSSSSCAYVSTSLIADKVVAYLNSTGIK